MDPQPAPVVTPAAAPPTTVVLQGPVRILVDQTSSRWSRYGRRILWALLAIFIISRLFTMGGEKQANEQYHSLTKGADDKIAIISVEGLIVGGEGFVKKQIDQVREDKRVKAIVLRVDSPGGTVTGSDYIYHHLKKLIEEKQIPMVVSMGGIAASGGYYVSMAAGDHPKIIYAEPTTWTGSIGVIIPHYDLSGLLARFDVSDDSIASHRFKQMGSPTRKLPEPERAEERALLKELVDESFSGFKAIVLASRSNLKDNQELQDTVFTGRIFTATQAKSYGLVDELGFLEDAIDRAIELARLDKSRVQVVHYVKPTGLTDLLMGLEGRSAKSFDLSTLLDQTSPRACYLWTWPQVSGE